MTSPRWIRILLCLVPLTIGNLACARSSASEDGFVPRPKNPRQFLTVTNDHWYPVNVYQVMGGTRFRLGTVHTMRTEVFRLPDYVQAGGALRLLIDPAGSGGAFLTDEIIVGPGQSVIFKVQTRLAASSWFVR